MDFGTPEVYLEALRRPDLLAHPSLREGACPNGHEAHVARTFAASTDRLDAQDPTDALALSTLAHAAHFAPGEAIPLWLLARALGVDWNDPQTQARLIDALRRLSNLGLIEQDNGAPTLHRLIAAFARDEDAAVETTREAVEEAVEAAAGEQNRSGLPGPLLVWQAHLRHIAKAAADDGTDAAGGLMNALGYHLDMIGDLDGARAAYQRALDIFEKALGPDHPNVATGVNNLGSVLKALGDLNGARAAIQRALYIDEKEFGPDHPTTRTVRDSLNRLGP